MPRKTHYDDCQEFLGQFYVRWKGENYYIRRQNHKKLYLHRIVWEHHHGPIPRGMCVHHIDDDRTNNDIANLQLITRVEHGRLHMLKNSARLSARAKQLWEDTEIALFRCANCGSLYSNFVLARSADYCSTRCRMQLRRRRRGLRRAPPLR